MVEVDENSLDLDDSFVPFFSFVYYQSNLFDQPRHPKETPTHIFPHLPSNKNENPTVHNEISLFLLTGALEFPLWLSALSHQGPVLCHLFQLAGNVCGCQKRLALVV